MRHMGAIGRLAIALGTVAVIGLPRVAGAAEPFSVVCHSAGLIAATDYRMSIEEPKLFVGWLSPSISMETPFRASMTVLHYSAGQIVAYALVKPPGLPEGYLTASIDRETGAAEFVFAKTPVRITGTTGIWYSLVDEQLRPTEHGLCERVRPRF
jgi:hypothetical protein